MTTSLSDLLRRADVPRLAVEFRKDAIALFSLGEDGEWREKTAVRVDAPDLNDRAADMRRIAAKLSGSQRPRADIWLPREQVANLDLPADVNPRAAALEAITRDGPLTAQDLVVATTRCAEGHAASVVEKIVVDEARAYIARWGFSPQRITTRHGHAAFAAGPTFARGDNHRTLRVGAIAAAAAVVFALALGWLLSGGDDAPVGSAETRDETVATAPNTEAAAEAPAPVSVSRTPEAAAAPVQREATETAPDAPDPTAAATPSEDAAENTAEELADEPAPDEAPRLSTDAAEPHVRPAPGGALAAPTGDGALSLVILSDPLEPGPTISFADIAASVGARASVVRIPPPGAAQMSLRVLTPAEPAAFFTVAPFSAGAARPDAPIALASLGDAPTAYPPSPETPGDLSGGVDIGAEPDEEQDSAETITRRELAITNDPRAPAPPPEEEDAYAPGPGAVAASPAPVARPDSLDMTPSTLAAATAPVPGPRPKSIKPRPKSVASGEVRTVSRAQRGPPAGPGVSNAATLNDAMDLSQMNLLGVFGKQGSRRALLRLPNGDVMRVSKGTVVEGWVVSRIDRTSMRITRGGEAQTLNVVQ